MLKHQDLEYCFQKWIYTLKDYIVIDCYNLETIKKGQRLRINTTTTCFCGQLTELLLVTSDY